MRRLTPGRGPSSRPGQLYAVEETPSQKLDSLSRNRRLSRVSSIPARQFQAGCPIEKPIPKTKTKKNEPTRRRIYNRTTPGEKGGLDSTFPTDSLLRRRSCLVSLRPKCVLPQLNGLMRRSRPRYPFG